MGDDAQYPGVVDEGVAGDAGGGLVGFAEAAVDDDELAAALDGTLALLGFDGDVAVDDVAVGAFQAKFLEEHIAHGRVLVIGVVGVLGLGPGALVLDEPALEGGHPVPAEDGAVASGPEEPEKVHAQLVVVGLAGGGVGVVQELLSFPLLAADLEGEQLSVCRHGDTAVEEKVSVEDLVEAALGVEEADVLLQLLTAQEGGGELIDDRIFFGGEGVGVFGVHGGEVHVLQGIGSVSNGDALVGVVDLVQQQAVAHAILGMAQQLLALQLKEDDGDGLVHAGGEKLILLAVLVGVGAGELDGKAVDVAVLIYLVG